MDSMPMGMPWQSAPRPPDRYRANCLLIHRNARRDVGWNFACPLGPFERDASRYVGCEISLSVASPEFYPAAQFGEFLIGDRKREFDVLVHFQLAGQLCVKVKLDVIPSQFDILGAA